MIFPGAHLPRLSTAEKHSRYNGSAMIPDYLTFIRFQDKRNLLLIYVVTLILLGFYGKNSGFSFSREDAWCVSGILALVLYAFITDLRAYWAYKCVVKNVDLSCFLDDERSVRHHFLFSPFTVLAGAAQYQPQHPISVLSLDGHRAVHARWPRLQRTVEPGPA